MREKWNHLWVQGIGLSVLTVWMLFAFPIQVQAVPAYPGVIEIMEKSTETTISGRMYGDEYFSYTADLQGYVIEEDACYDLRYVVPTEDGYAFGGYVTQDDAPDADALKLPVEDEAFQEKLTALRDSVVPLLMLGADEPNADGPAVSGSAVTLIPEGYDYQGDALEGKLCDWTEEYKKHKKPEKGDTCPLLVVKLKFNDVECAFDDQAWHDRIFGTAEGVKSVSSYYNEVSNGKFTYVPATENSGVTPNDGVATAVLPISCPVYDPRIREITPGLYQGTDDKNYALYNVTYLMAYAVHALEDQIDFASYDRNNDTYIDPTELAVLLVFPGMEAAKDALGFADWKPGMWSHSAPVYRMTGEDTYVCNTVRADGVELYKYTIIAENHNMYQPYDYYTKQGNPILASIGTAIHELGHDLGLMDLYNTGNESVSENVFGLSLMALGSWGTEDPDKPGSSPAHLDPYSKIYLGFYEASTATLDGKYVLYAAADSENYNILRINTDNPKVYYLVENRQPVGFDEGVSFWYRRKGVTDFRYGTVVWRIDEAVLEKTWDENTVNNNKDGYGIMPLFPAGNKPDRQPCWNEQSGSGMLREPAGYSFGAIHLGDEAHRMEFWLGRGVSVMINYADEILGTNLGLEYSTDSGTSWKNCTKHMKAEDFGWDGTKAVQVRFRLKAGEGGYEDLVTIPKRPDAPTGITGSNVTAAGEMDGKLNGVTAEMEYSLAGWEYWTACVPDMSVAAGTYEVRYRAGSDKFASFTCEVTVGTNAPESENPEPEDPKPEDPKPEDPKPEDPKPEDPKPEDPKPEDPKPEDPKPEDPKPEDPKPEDPKPEDPKPEDPQPSQPQPSTPDSSTSGSSQAESSKPEESKPEKAGEEKVVIEDAAKGTSATVTVNTDSEGKQTAEAEIVKVNASSSDKINATISSAVVDKITEAAGTKDVAITQKVVDDKGKTVCTVTVDAKELNAGNKLTIFKYDEKTDKYTIVNAKTYTVSKKGGVSLNVADSGDYVLMNTKAAEAVTKQILATVKASTSKKTVTSGKATRMKLSNKLDMENVAKITYASTDKSVARVDKNGKITAQKAGTATVKAKVTLKNGKTKTVTMKVSVKSNKKKS